MSDMVKDWLAECTDGRVSKQTQQILEAFANWQAAANAAKQADAAPVATSDRQDAIEAAHDVLAGRGNGTYDEALDAIRWLLQSACIPDAAPVAWMYQQEGAQWPILKDTPRPLWVEHGWTETPLYAAPVDDRVSTSSPVDVSETPETSGKDLIERVADSIEAVMGPLFGTPEYLADPVKLARAEKRRRYGALAYAQAAIAAIDLPAQREAAARAALEAALHLIESETDYTTVTPNVHRGRLAASIRAIDPAAFRGDSDAMASD